MTYLRGFDGLRAISILMVIGAHLGSAHLAAEGTFARRLLELGGGAAGVRIFFVISGFLITRLLLAERARTGRIRLGNFFARRFLRLMPAFYLYLATAVILMATGLLARNVVGTLFGAFYIFNFAPRIVHSNEYSHLWSLSVEEQFYLFWPFVVAAVTLPNARRVALSGAAICALVYLWDPNPVLDVRAPWIQALIAPLNFDLERYQHYFVDGRFFKLGDAFTLPNFTVPAIGAILVGCAAALGLPGRFVRLDLAALLFVSPLYLSGAPARLTPLLQATAVAVLLQWLVAHPRARLTNALERAPLAYVGRLSYGLYLWHGLFITTNGSGPAWFQAYPLNVGLSVLATLASYYLVERKFLRLKNRFIA